MKFFNLCIFGVLLLAAGCSMPLKTAAPAATPAEVVALADSIRSLGSHIDPLEATNAAQIAFDQTTRIYGILPQIGPSQQTETEIVH